MATGLGTAILGNREGIDHQGLLGVSREACGSPENLELSAKQLSTLMRSTKSFIDPELSRTIDQAIEKFDKLSESQKAQLLKVFSGLLEKCSASDLLDDNGHMLSPNTSREGRQSAIVKCLARAVAGIDSAEETQKVFSELNSLLNAKPEAGASTELLNQRSKLAFHLLFEIGVEDVARVSQKNDVTCVLTVANKDMAIEKPAEYIRIMRQWVLNGSANISLTDGQEVNVAYAEGALSSERMKDRTLGCALYQNTIANHYGIIETGMLPWSAERYYDDLHGGVKLLTPSTEVCSNTTSTDDIMAAAAGSSWVGVSMQWAQEGQEHSYHFVRLNGVVELNGKRYVKLENPWSSEDNSHIPADILANSKLLGGVGNELLMDEKEFKKRIYYALIKTGAEDRGETAGLNKDNNTITIMPDLLLKMFDLFKLKKADNESAEKRDARMRGSGISNLWDKNGTGHEPQGHS